MMNDRELATYLGLSEYEFEQLVEAAPPSKLAVYRYLAEVSANLEQLATKYNRPPAATMASDDAEDAASDTIGAAVRAGVSAYVVDGLQPQRVRPIIEVAIARFREFQALRRELEETRNKLAERKVIEKAKGLLMQQKGYSEEEAYQALRKLAMDRNQRLAEVARNVIAVLELLG